MPVDIESWLISNSMYRPDGEEVVRTPEFMLNDLDTKGYMEGDCDDFATLSGAIAKASGYETRFAAVRTEKANPEFTHVFTEVSFNNEWERIDPTVFRFVRIPEFDRIEVYV